MLGSLKSADFCSISTRKGTLLIAKKFRFQQGLRQRGAAHRHERFLRASAQRMKCVGDNFLSNSALTTDHDCRTRIGNLLNRLQNLSHGIRNCQEWLVSQHTFLRLANLLLRFIALVHCTGHDLLQML